MDVCDTVDPGTVVGVTDDEKLQPCAEPYDRRVVGVLSGAGGYSPAILLGNCASEEGRVPLALTGRVYCKIDADYGPIGVGDLLTTSATKGHAMRVNRRVEAQEQSWGRPCGRLAKAQV